MLSDISLFLQLNVPDDEFHALASPLIGKEIRFRHMVDLSYRQSYDIRQWAVNMGLSDSGFSKSFKTIYSLSPHKWLHKHRMDEVLKDVLYSALTLKQLTEVYGFYSQQHFGLAFKQQFERSPGQMRSEA